MKEITVDGTVYVPKGSEGSPAEKVDGLEYCIVRSDLAGVFAGYVASDEDGTVVILNSRRLWYWDGAASLSQLAMEGVSKPRNCKFPCSVPRQTIRGVIEIIPATQAAKDSIDGVAIWEG